MYADVGSPKVGSHFISSINALPDDDNNACIHCVSVGLSNVETNVYIAYPDTNRIFHFMAINDIQLQGSIAKSGLILTGKVSSIWPIETASDSRVTEHDPSLVGASIEVDAILKGNLSEKEIRVLFSNSYDVSWYQAPKLRLGDYGIFFLHQKENIKALNVEAYTLLNKGDFQSVDNLDQIKKLIKSAAG